MFGVWGKRCFPSRKVPWWTGGGGDIFGEICTLLAADECVWPGELCGCNTSAFCKRSRSLSASRASSRSTPRSRVATALQQVSPGVTRACVVCLGSCASHTDSLRRPRVALTRAMARRNVLACHLRFAHAAPTTTDRRQPPPPQPPPPRRCTTFASRCHTARSSRSAG